MTEFDGLLTRAANLAHSRILSTIAEKVAPQHAALLVIDMQNEFCSADGHIARSGKNVTAGQALAGRLPTFIAAARDAGVLVIFVRNIYSTPTNHYLSDVWLEQAARRRAGGGTLEPVCGQGAWGAEFYGDVRPGPTDPIVTKHRYSAFHNTDLDTILRAHAIRTVILTGVVTNVCVETTAREAHVRDYYVVLVDDGTAAYSQVDHESTLRNIDRFFGEVSTIAQLRKVWTVEPAVAPQQVVEHSG
jgi:ureidoacrylate peracid hydrolase